MSEVLFALPLSFHREHDQVLGQIARASDEEIVAADGDAWADQLVATVKIDPPTPDLDGARAEDLGPVKVDCTNMAGVTRTLSEYRVIRDGVRIKLTVPVGGRADLLAMRPQQFGWTDEPGFIEGQSVIRTWDWPLVKQAEFGAEIERFKERLQFAAQMLEAAAEKFLVQLREEAAKAIRERTENVLARRSFIEDLPVPVLPREGAPARFTLPPLVAKATPAVKVTGRAPQPLSGPLLGELYDHILSVITAMGTGMERVPAAYADTVEETLRDYLLVVLNTHYEGQAQAEAFNKSGKTDVLIRVQNQTLFVGECKWWSGVSGFSDALDQLKSYSTWRDSRLALIVFVPNAGFHDVVDKARIALEARDEFVSWHSGGGDSEIRCKMTWPDDPGRKALLAVMFFHLPRSS